MNDEPIDPIRLQVAKFIEDLIQVNWLSNLARPEVDVAPRDSDGGTDAATYTATATISLFVKHHTTAAPLEFRGYSYLRQGSSAFATHLVPPLAILEDVNPIWVAPYAERTSLHTVAMRRNSKAYREWLIALYRDVLENMKQLWVSTRNDRVAPNISDIYYRSRFVDRQSYFNRGFHTNHINDLEIVVSTKSNGTKSYGKYRDIASLFSQRVNEAAQAMPQASCTVHGDEHANNILVKQELAHVTPDAWLIVDYVNATQTGDWAFSLGKMLYWWKFYCVIEMAKNDADLRSTLDGHWHMDDDRLLLYYDPQRLRSAKPAICAQLEGEVMKLAREVGEQFGEDHANVQERLRLAQVAAIWGSVAYHFSRYPFAVPIMLGEALNILRPPSSKPKP